MHAWVSHTSADTHRCPLHQEPLDLPLCVFKYKLCYTNSSDLSVWSSFAPFCIWTAVPNGLPVLAFADSKRSHCKWIPNDSKPLPAWFGGMPSAPIFLYHPSTKTGVPLDGKSCTAGIEKTEPWPCPSTLASRSIDCVRFRVKARFLHHHHHWCEVVPGNVSLPVVERWLWGTKQITRCTRGGRRWVNRFGSDRCLRSGNGRFELTKFESICLRKQQSQPWLLGSIIFRRIPRVSAIMECIHWVVWRTSSVSTCVSLSWCLHPFERSKSSDAMPRAKESTEFDSPFQGEHSFETSSSSYTKVSVPGRSCGCIELSLTRTSTYPYKPCWNPLSLSIEGIQAFTLIMPNVSKRGRSGRLLVYMLGLTTSGDRFWVILPWQGKIFRGLYFSFHRAI